MEPEIDSNRRDPILELEANIRVLYIKNDGCNTLEWSERLERVNDSFDVTIKFDFEVALKNIHDTPVDCVLCDYDLEESNGLRVLERVREFDSELPFILLTDDGDEDIASDAISAGVTDYFQKNREENQLEVLANCIERVVERYHSQRAVKRERVHRDALFENTPDPIVRVTFDAQTPEIVDVNAAFEAVFGFEEEAVIGSSIRDVIVPDSEQVEHRSIRDDVVEGAPVETEVRRQTNAGIRQFKLRVIPIDGANGVRGAYAWYTDITEQKQYEERLESLNEAGQNLMTATTETEVANITVKIAQEVLEQPLTAMWSFDADAEVLRPLAATDAATELNGSRDVGNAIGKIPAGTTEINIFHEGKLTEIEDYSSVENPAHPDTPLGTILIAPLGRHGQLHIGSRTVQPFDDTTRDLVEILCQNAEAALERVHREQTLSNLSELTSELVQASSTEDVVTVAAEAGSEILELPYTHVYLTNDDGEVLEPVAVTDATRNRFGELPRFQRGEGLFWETISAGEVRLYDDVQTKPGLASDVPFRGAVIAPLDKRGVFASGSLQPAEFNAFDKKLVSILAATTVEALNRAEREQRLRDREQELKRARDQFQSVFEHSNDAIMIFDPDADEVLEANPQASELLGHSYEELLSMGPSDIHPEEMDQFRAFLDTIRTEGSGRTDKISCLTESGEYVSAEISASTLEFGGRDSVLALIRDVSELRKYERELERKNDRLEDFANIISHDLRNPLNVAMGRVEIAHREREIECLETAKSSLERMEEMIGDLLALTRAGESVEETNRVSLDSIVEGCWRNVDTREATLEASVEMTIYADKSRLRHVLENLFRNAIEHGGSDVTIRVGLLSNDTGFYVEDNGPGISPEDRDNVFEQGYSTTEDGTGFGLSIVKEIVEAHGWDITVTDGTNGGARFGISGVDVE
ncbi:PAS domain S-box protein [Haloplanus pelagicus]|uniref:PAS domain S-box protein n=1 Tax=Haloplanus pelagicus TaxID=2949995 RepID=UPI00203B7A07|nr:PAS domain S-box protein [Haloplanus sp. HW8-1]